MSAKNRYTQLKRYRYTDARFERVFEKERSNRGMDYILFHKKYQQISVLIRRYHESEYEKVKELTDLTKLLVFGVLAACGDESSQYIDESTLPETKSFYSYKYSRVDKHQAFILGANKQSILGESTTLGYETAYPNPCLNILITLKLEQLQRLAGTHYGLTLLMEEMNKIIPLKLDFNLAFSICEEDYAFRLGDNGTQLGYSTALVAAPVETGIS